MISKEQIQEYFKAGQLDKIIEHETEIIAQEEDDDAKQALALAYFHSKQFEHSTPLFQKLAEKRNVSSAWFHVCTSAVAEKKFELAEEAYKKTQELVKFEKHTQHSVPVSMMGYIYMSALADAGNYTAALPLLEKMKNNYKAIFITQDHFAASRHLPFFSIFLLSAKTIFQNTSDKNFASAWFNDFISGVDSDGKEKLEELRKELGV
ncbi:MAG: tetratricopeptide repeat protein [Chitinophagales bacterium]